MDKLSDTIAAIATPYGEGSIAIIRISGEETINIISQFFLRPKGKKLKEIESHRLYYGYIIDPSSRKKIDEVMLALMKKPNSYTREDVAEISCHGGMAISRTILQLVLSCGARLAEPGEFTRRAFLNGRIDLVQAEGVNETIKAKSEADLGIALGQVEGRLSREIKEIREVLGGLLAHIEASLDFAEEGIALPPTVNILADIEEALSRIITLIESYDRSKTIREGINLVIVGRPNVGKSSLMNCLLREDRAIVTPIPGTTRDVLAEEIELGGVPLRLKDTAGILEDCRDLIEAEGIRRTKEALEKGDIILLVLDGSHPMDTRDAQVISLVSNKETLAIINKIDLPQKVMEEDLIPSFKLERIIPVSAKEGYGIEELKQKIAQLIQALRISPWEGAVLTKLRQREALVKARDRLLGAKRNIESRLPEEIWSIDLKEAIDSLAELLGETYDEEVLDRIFSTFCIGK